MDKPSRTHPLHEASKVMDPDPYLSSNADLALALQMVANVSEAYNGRVTQGSKIVRAAAERLTNPLTHPG